MRSRFQHPRGLTLLESMFLLVIMSIVAVAAGVGLQAVAKVPAITDKTMAINNVLVSTLEEWKSKPFASMVTPQPDTVTINGTNYTRTILVEDADPDATTDPATFATTKTDFHRISVTINNQTMRCYVTQP